MRILRCLLLMLSAGVVWQPAAFGPSAAWAQAVQQQPGPAYEAAHPSMSPAMPVTNVAPPALGPMCAPPATLLVVGPSTFPGQTQQLVEACATTAPACPPGSNPAGASLPPNNTLFCCPNGMNASGPHTNQCCPPGTPGSGAICGGAPVPAITVNCPAGAVALGPTQCFAPATCASGYTLTGTSCCPNDRVSSLGSCCPPGQPPRAGGGCTLPTPPQTANQIPPPVEQYVIPPQGLKVVPPGASAGTTVTNVAPPPPAPTCGSGTTMFKLMPSGWTFANSNGAPPGTWFDACAAPVPGCPSGTFATGTPIPPTSAYYCCPNGTSWDLNGPACVSATATSPVPAVVMNCPGGAIAYSPSSPQCVTPANCPSGYVLTGTSCTPTPPIVATGPGVLPNLGAQPIEMFKVPPQGLQAVPSTSVGTPVTIYQPSPICGPGATVTTLTGAATGGTLMNPFTGQPQAIGLDVCTTPATNCPAGTVAASTPVVVGPPPPPSAIYFCCPADKRIYWSDGSCCPPGALPDGAHSGCVPGQAATCNGQALAIGGANPVCATPAICQNGYTLTGTTCCPNNMLSSVGTCCPPGSPPRAGGGDCTPPPPPPPVLTPNLPQPVPPPAVNLDECPKETVPRDAFQGDRVCVTRATREQIIVDNSTAPSRTLPDGNCRRGFVWREAGPHDHVCVPPASRTQVWVDNRQQCGGDLHCRNGVVSRPTSTAPDKPPRLTFGPRGPRREPLPRTRTNKPRSSTGHTTAFRTTTRHKDIRH